MTKTQSRTWCVVWLMFGCQYKVSYVNALNMHVINSLRKIFPMHLLSNVSSVLPGEAAFTVAASLFHRQHIRVSLTGKQQLTDFKVSGNSEPSTFSGTVKPFDPRDAARHGRFFDVVPLQNETCYSLGESGEKKWEVAPQL